MTTLVTQQISNGQSVDASPVDANFDAIVAVVNGGIDNGNIAAGAGMVGSKLLPVRIATTVAGLGTAADGALGRLILGSSPYDFIDLVYSATYAKWVSDTVRIWSESDGSGLSWNGTSYADLAGTFAAHRGYIRGFKAAYDAALRPQYRLIGAVSLSSASGTGTVGLKTYEFNDGDGPGSSIQATETNEVTVTVATSLLRATDWVAPSLSAPAEAHAFVALRAKHSTGAASVRVDNGALDLRWTS